MRIIFNVLMLSTCMTLAACSGGAQVANQNAQNQSRSVATPAATPAATQASDATSSASSPMAPLGVAPAHGSGSINSSTGGSAPAAAGATDKAPVATPELDAKINKTLKKAKAAGATASDKKAAADAYMARGNFYWSAGDVRLYRFALGDFRRVLRFDPSNADAQTKIDELVRIYGQLGRPVPDIGNEQ